MPKIFSGEQLRRSLGLTEFASIYDPEAYNLLIRGKLRNLSSIIEHLTATTGPELGIDILDRIPRIGLLVFRDSFKLQDYIDGWGRLSAMNADWRVAGFSNGWLLEKVAGRRSQPDNSDYLMPTSVVASVDKRLWTVSWPVFCGNNHVVGVDYQSVEYLPKTELELGDCLFNPSNPVLWLYTPANLDQISQALAEKMS
jgi:hypothetical protein